MLSAILLILFKNLVCCWHYWHDMFTLWHPKMKWEKERDGAAPAHNPAGASPATRGQRGPGNEFTLLPAEAGAWQPGCAYQAQRSLVIPGARVTNDDTANILRWLITPTYTTHYTNLASNAMLITLLYLLCLLLLCFDHLNLNPQNLLTLRLKPRNFLGLSSKLRELLKIDNYMYMQILNK